MGVKRVFVVSLASGLISIGCGRVGFDPLADTAPEDSGMDTTSPIDAATEDAVVDATPDAPTGPVCGDAVVTPPEACDDGDREPGDGCDPSCIVETGWTCRFEPSLCAEAGFAPAPAGVFRMGAPAGEPGRVDTGENTEVLHEVELTRPFAIQNTEVTQGDYEALMGWNPSEFGPLGPGPACGPSCPVERSSWYDGAMYANRMSVSASLPSCYVLVDVVCGDTMAAVEPRDCQTPARLGIASATVTLSTATPYDCIGYRYPTEAEWEYAARAGDTRGTYAGELELLGCESPNPVSDRISWFCGNAGATTHPVALLEPNAWGLYDMLGNVWEHVHDLHEPLTAAPATDPFGPATSATPSRVARGGAWLHSAFSARAARRSPALGPQRQVGFRLARTL